MIVQRHTFVVKQGRVEEAVKIIQDSWEWPESEVIPHRAYRTISGQNNEIFQDLEFEDFEARDKWWADVRSRPEWAPFVEKINTVLESLSSEFLGLVE